MTESMFDFSESNLECWVLNCARNRPNICQMICNDCRGSLIRGDVPFLPVNEDNSIYVWTDVRNDICVYTSGLSIDNVQCYDSNLDFDLDSNLNSDLNSNLNSDNNINSKEEK